MKSATEKLKEQLAVMNHYQRALTLLEWDMYTATPRNGYEQMSRTVEYFSQLHFDMSTSDSFYELLAQANESAVYQSLDRGMQYTVRTLYRDLTKNRNIPKPLFAKYVKSQNMSRKAWEEAKAADDFSLFEPHLQEMIDLTIEKSAYTDPGREVYDVLLDQYEEGMTASQIDRVFRELKTGLEPLLAYIATQEDVPSPIYCSKYSKNQQKKVQKLLLEYIGFDFAAGTTAESVHPFTLGFSRDDVRLTNHFYRSDPLSAMFSAIHEGGHAIFDQNVDPALMGTQAQSCQYMGIHESQSRFYENILGRRKSFWVPIYDQIQKLLPGLADVSLDTFADAITYVRPSLIRTEADEVTYCHHIILRYEMEQEIFRNGAKAKELPAMWNEKMQALLGITPDRDSHGILQDMHWSDGSFGYFPSYLLGSVYDGMFLEALTQEMGDVDEILAAGEIRSITKWLNEKIHRYGGLRLPAQVIEDVCHKPLSAEPLLRYFNEKYMK